MDNKGVSAVIGIILMVAMTVAIAATVYVYVVSDGFDDIEQTSGNITEKFREGNQHVLTYHFVIDDSFDICVDEKIFYSYDVGDFYEV